MDLSDVFRVIAPWKRRILLMVARALVRDANDGTRLQELQLSILRGEERDHLEVMGSLGITSVPKPGAEAVVLFLGGNRDHGIVVGVGDRSYRPTGLKPGETAVYDAAGSRITLLADGSILLSPRSGTLRVAGDLTVAGEVRDHGDGGQTLEEMRQLYDIHVHPDPQGGTTGPPVPTMEG
jgi:phage baseplate assembly protein V